MDEAFRFGATTVTCEGYNHPDDPNVLAGSCGVEYTLYLTNKGKEWQARSRGDHQQQRGYHQEQQQRSRDYYGEEHDVYDDGQSFDLVRAHAS